MSVNDLALKAWELRRTIVRMNHLAGSGHTGGSLSCAEILTVLYHCFMNLRPDEPQWELRDRFVLSKGHAAPALYATLVSKGYFNSSHLDTLRKTGSILQGHPCMFKVPGIDMSTGSLGMGLSVGLGMALSAKLKNQKWKVFVLCGDGEMDEGQNWEAFMAIAKWKPPNLVTIIDRNHVQLDGTENEIMPLGSLEDKIRSFGLKVINCDGHDVCSLYPAIQKAVSNAPSVVVAETVKGKGVSFMEGKSEWHGKPINNEDYAKAILEIETRIAELKRVESPCVLESSGSKIDPGYL
jgi:transketolase